MKHIRVNREIQSPELLVIDANNKQLGIKSIFEALQIAEAQDLDLVEVGPTSNPPVARVMDYGKYCYEQEKRLKQKNKGDSQLKEVRISINIDRHDWLVKVNRAKKFLQDAGRVRVFLQLIGRQMLFQQKAIEKLQEFCDALGGEFEARPEKLGKRYYVLIKKKRQDAQTEDK